MPIRFNLTKKERSKITMPDDKPKMKAKTQFLKMYYKLPEQARKELVYGYPDHPMTLNVIALEIRNNTKLGTKVLEDLGFWILYKEVKTK